MVQLQVGMRDHHVSCGWLSFFVDIHSIVTNQTKPGLLQNDRLSRDVVHSCISILFFLILGAVT